MLVPRLKLPYEVKIESYGVHSTTIRKKFGWINKGTDAFPPDVITVEKSDRNFDKVRKRD